MSESLSARSVSERAQPRFLSTLRAVLFTGLVFVSIELKPDFFPPRDFVEYWSAATVLAHGGNPYDGKQLLKVP